MSRLHAVAGWPVLASSSPALFHAALPDAGPYVRLAERCAADALELARRAPLTAMNVTAPFKQDMARLVAPGDDAAKVTAAVNVVVHREGVMLGYNTDGQGVIGALQGQGHDPAGKRAVVLGAGGAARAAAHALRAAGASRVTLVNRSLARAQQAAQELGCDAAPLPELQDTLEQAEVFVSCVPRAVEAIGPLALRRDLVVLDADYHGSGLELRARASGCRVVSGLDWLIHQAIGTHRLLYGRSASPATLANAIASGSRPWSKRNIAVIGFMGAGKSTVAPRIASRMSWALVETDDEVRSRAGLELPAIFAQRGEPAFRELEHEAIRGMQTTSERVFSLGGGALARPDNLELVRRHALVVWLWADASTCWSRASDGTRPVLGSLQEATSLLQARQLGYAQAADLVLDAGGASPDELAERVVDEVRSAQRP